MPTAYADGPAEPGPAGGTDALQGPIADDIREWRASLERRGRDARYIRQAVHAVEDFARSAGWQAAEDATARDIESHLGQISADRGLTGTSQNRLLGYLSAFLGWCAKTERAEENVAARVPKAVELREGGNRAFTPEEAAAVIAAARADAESEAPRFKARGRWRMYTVAWFTGLRRSELRRLTVGEVDLGPVPKIVLKARTAKARRQQTVPLHPEAAAVLREWFEVRQRAGELRPHDRVFEFVRDETVIRDIEAAGVPRQIGGKTTGLHSFRHGLATQLAAQGAPEAVAQAILRHSDPRLTRNVYTDARLLPLADAVSRVGLAGCEQAQKNLIKSVEPGTDCADTLGAEAKDPMTLTTLPIDGTSEAGPSGQRGGLSNRSANARGPASPCRAVEKLSPLTPLNAGDRNRRGLRAEPGRPGGGPGCPESVSVHIHIVIQGVPTVGTPADVAAVIAALAERRGA